jgi:hypothetical protein
MAWTNSNTINVATRLIKKVFDGRVCLTAKSKKPIVAKVVTIKNGEI